MNCSNGLMFRLQCLVGLVAALFMFMAQNALPQELPRPSGPVWLTVTGMIEKTNGNGAALIDENILSAFPEHRIETHTPWTDGVARFEGVLLSDVLTAVGASGNLLYAEAINGYRIELPISDAEEFGVLLAMRMNGKVLSRRDKGPLWIVYPRDRLAEIRDERYDSRWVWQLNRLEVR